MLTETHNEEVDHGLHSILLRLSGSLAWLQRLPTVALI